MPASKPTLGYSSRTEAAVALRAEGLSEPAIAEKIGVSRNAIAGLLARAKDSRQAPQIGRGTSRGNADRLAAKAAGIMLSHEAARPIHRPTSDGAMRVIELKLPEAQFGKLVEMARKAARTPSAYATDLFQAAYSARCAPTGDVALDAQVGRLGTPEAPLSSTPCWSDDMIPSASNATVSRAVVSSKTTEQVPPSVSTVSRRVPSFASSCWSDSTISSECDIIEFLGRCQHKTIRSPLGKRS